MFEQSLSQGPAVKGHLPPVLSVPAGPSGPAEHDAFERRVAALQRSRREPRPPAAPEPLSPAWLLRLGPRTSRAEAAPELLLSLRRIASARAHADLALGHGLRLLSARKPGQGSPLRHFDLATLGHARFDDFCAERLGFSGAHGRELKRLDASLERLPELRRAFLAGLSRARVLECSRVATPETEAGWVRLALRTSTRRLRELARAVARGRAEDPAGPSVHGTVAADGPRQADGPRLADGPALSDGLEVADGLDDERVRVRVSWRGLKADQLTWRRHGLAMARSVVGVNGPEHVLAEAMAADVLGTLGAAPPEPEAEAEASRTRGDGHPRARPPKPGQLRRLARKLRRSRALQAASPFDRPDWPEPPDWEACFTAWDVLARIRSIADRRHALDWERAKLLAIAHRASLDRELGFPDFDTFVDRGLGLAPRDAYGALRLVKRLRSLRRIEEAWKLGRLSQRRVAKLVEVAAEQTQADWISFAQVVTNKLLDDAVAWAQEEALRRAGRGDVADVSPPWELTPRELQSRWLQHFAPPKQRSKLRELLAEVGAPVTDEQLEELFTATATATATAASSRRSLLDIGFGAPRSVARVWHAALAAVREAAFGGADGPWLTDAEAVRVLLHLFARAHLGPEVMRALRRHRALLRDGYRCTAPGCTAVGRHEEHHVIFRSHGGPDALFNLSGLCRVCHRLVHEGLMQVTGRAPHGLTWGIGPRAGDDRGPREVYRDERLVRRREAA